MRTPQELACPGYLVWISTLVDERRWEAAMSLSRTMFGVVVRVVSLISRVVCTRGDSKAFVQSFCITSILACS